MTHEEAVMKRLTAEDLAELERLPYSRGHAMVAYGDMCALLAMASRLVEVESALEFLNRDELNLFLSQHGDGEFCEGDLTGNGILAAAKALGWTSPTQKQGDR